jgi:hypothetical protein
LAPQEYAANDDNEDEDGIQLDALLCGGDVVDCSTLLTEFLLPHLESEAACFGRSTSSLCGPYAARLCNVSATVSPVGHSASWDATAARARELLVGLPRQSIDTSIDAMRRLRERSTTDLSFRPVIDPIVVHTQ